MTDALPLQVFTARIGCTDADAFDITRKSAGPLGIVFAPSWEILRPAIEARRAGEDMETRWPAYVAAYTAEMVASRTAHPAAWTALLARRRVVLLCYCADPLRCHRTVLGRDILPSLGTVFRGGWSRLHKR